MDWALKKVIFLCHMVFRGLSVQRFDLLPGDRGWKVLTRLRSPWNIYGRCLLCSIRLGPGYILRPTSRWCKSWLGRAHSWFLASVNVERLDFNVWLLLVCWFEGCTFLFCAVWVHNASAMTAPWPAVNLIHRSAHLSCGYLLSLVPLGNIKYLHRLNQMWSWAQRLLAFGQ